MVLNQKTDVFKEQKNRHFRKGIIHSVCPKIQLFLSECFLWKLFQKRSRFDILDRTKWFLNQKIEVFKRAHISTFSKGDNLWFLSENLIFSQSAFCRNCHDRSCFYILDTRECFLD